MLINRKNYESFFLLYADDELCTAEKVLVENFVAENADLRQEFDMLQAAVLPRETISFPRKSELYSNAVSHGHMQENLLLHIDGELSELDRQKTESLISTHPDTKKEYEVLLQARLNPADHIIFPDKHLLYRRAKDNVLIGRFVRWAAAAILLGIGLFYGISLLNKNNNRDLAVNTVRPIPAAKEKSPSIKEGSERSGSEPMAVLIEKIPVVKGAGTSNNKKPVVATNEKFTDVTAPRNINNRSSVTIVKRDEQVSVKKENTIPMSADALDEISVPIMASAKEPEKKPVPDIREIVVPQIRASDYTTSFAANIKNENKILYMDEDEVKRSKPFGILRKAKRFVERSAKLKPGNTLRIASFEFKGG